MNLDRPKQCPYGCDLRWLTDIVAVCDCRTVAAWRWDGFELRLHNSPIIRHLTAALDAALLASKSALLSAAPRPDSLFHAPSPEEWKEADREARRCASQEETILLHEPSKEANAPESLFDSGECRRFREGDRDRSE